MLLLAVFVSAPAPAAFAEPKRSPSSGPFLEGWDDLVLDAAQRPGLVELRLHLGGEGWDNLRQSPVVNAPERSVAARSEARLACRLSSAPLKMHLEAGQLRYNTRRAMTAFGGGIAFEGDRHTLHLSTRAELNRPSLDTGVGADVPANLLLVRLRYGFRSSRVELWTGADHAPQRFPEAPARNSEWQAVHAGASFLGLSRKLAPELVFGWARNELPGDSEVDFQQRRAQLGLRYTPVRAVAVTGRLELARLTFGVTRPNAINYGRRDDRRYGSLQCQVRLTRQAAWTLTVDRLENRSTRTNRFYTADSVSAALTLKLGSTSAVSTVPRAPHPAAPHPTAARPIVESPVAQPPPVAVIPERVPVDATACADAAAAADPAAVAADATDSVSQRLVADGMTIETRRHGDATEAVIHGVGLARYSTLDLRGPLRFVVDLVGVAAPSSAAIPVESPLVGGIRVAAFRRAPAPVARVVFDLKVPVSARLEREGDALRVVLRPVVARASRSTPDRVP
jgi:hypothetical protein